MKIAEIFYSVQGEGMLVGTPSTFVRFSGCNLRCTWCDTPYTSWQPEGQELSLEQILARVQGAHAVITGGEPMLFAEVIPLTDRLKKLGLHITIETAGTVYLPVAACDLMSISPKLANSTPRTREGGRFAMMHDRLRYQPGVLRRLMAEYPYQLKFVLSDPADLTEILQIVKTTGAEHSRVLLMPEGTDATIVNERGRWIAEMCKREDFRYSPRLHVDLYGNKRGT